MNTLVKTIGAAVTIGAVALAGVAPAAAAPWWGYHRHGYYPYHRVAPVYPGYGYGYGYGFPGYYPYAGAAIGSAIVGGIVGTIAGAAVGGGGHVWRCEHTYRSYSAASDTYMGYDGVRHLCRL